MQPAFSTSRADHETFVYCQTMGIENVTPDRCGHISGNLRYKNSCQGCECPFRFCTACVLLGPKFQPKTVTNFKTGLCDFHIANGEAAEPQAYRSVTQIPPKKPAGDTGVTGRKSSTWSPMDLLKYITTDELLQVSARLSRLIAENSLEPKALEALEAYAKGLTYVQTEAYINVTWTALAKINSMLLMSLRVPIPKGLSPNVRGRLGNKILGRVYQIHLENMKSRQQ